MSQETRLLKCISYNCKRIFMEWATNDIIIIIIIIIRVFYPRAGPSLQAQEPRLQFCRKQVFHRKLRNQGCSFNRDLIGPVASRCFPHPTLSLASEQTLKDLKVPRGTKLEVRRVDLANWALRTSQKFTTGVKYQFHQGFWPDQRSGNPNQPSPPLMIRYYINWIWTGIYFDNSWGNLGGYPRTVYCCCEGRWILWSSMRRHW